MRVLKRIWAKFKTLLKQGLTPKQLALSLVISTLISVFPIFGISTIALTCIALPFRLNLPVMIAFSYIVGPLKLLLLIPFINLGASVFGTEHTLLTFEAIKASYEVSFFDTVKSLSYELLCGFVGWLFIAVPSGVVLYLLLKATLTFFNKFRNNKPSIL